MSYMCKLKLTLRVKRYGIECSSVDLINLPFSFVYLEDDNNICIYADSFEGDFNGFSFPIHAIITHNLNDNNYDLTLNGKHCKMIKSDREITISLQDNEETKLITFEIIS